MIRYHEKSVSWGNHFIKRILLWWKNVMMKNFTLEIIQSWRDNFIMGRNFLSWGDSLIMRRRCYSMETILSWGENLIMRRKSYCAKRVLNRMGMRRLMREWEHFVMREGVNLVISEWQNFITRTFHPDRRRVNHEGRIKLYCTNFIMMRRRLYCSNPEKRTFS